jgi:hypothetical protein
LLAELEVAGALPVVETEPLRLGVRELDELVVGRGVWVVGLGLG